MEHHRFSLQEGLIDIDQWKGHSVGFNKCRMKMGLILTGKGDKIVGLVGTRICIWRRNGKRSIFLSNEGTFVKGLCMHDASLNMYLRASAEGTLGDPTLMDYCLVGGVALQNGGLKERGGQCYCATLSYNDPEAVVGCEDGTARLFDVYIRKCSQIIRMRAGPVTCLCLSDDQLILSGSSLGSITVSGSLSDWQLATLRSRITIGVHKLSTSPDGHKDFVLQCLFTSSVCWINVWTYILLGPSDNETSMGNTSESECCLFCATPAK